MSKDTVFADDRRRSTAKGLNQTLQGRELIGKHLMQVRISAGFKSPDAAAEEGERIGVNISRQHLYKMESGKVNFEIRKLEEVLMIYNMTLPQFLMRFGTMADLPKKHQEIHEEVQAVLDFDASMAHTLKTTVRGLLTLVRQGRGGVSRV